ncbi:MAG: LPS export ABC transporter periplasmic protein LptC [Pseudomonadota bacterium]
MAVADNSYSRFVQFAKVALPLLALGLLSTLFLFSKSVNPEDAIPFVEDDVESIAEKQQIAAPKFSGVTTDGSKVTVSADFATPDPENPRRIAIENTRALVVAPTGREIEISALTAIYDGATERVTFRGDVDVITSTGYRLRSEELQTSLAETQLLSPGPLTGTGPSGVLTAGRMEVITRNGVEVLVFNRGVKLVYQPDN